MAIPTSRESLAQYCLAKLGNGAVDIAITEQQLSDRIDDAIQFYQEFNYDGVERLYWQHIITGNTLGVVNAAVFSQPEQITGLTSGATVALINLATDTTLTVGVPVGTFSIGETIVGQESGATAVVTAWTNGDISNRYVTCPDYIQAVTNIFPFGASSNTNNVFDIRFQLKLSDIYALQTANLSQYVQIQFHLGLIEDEFNPKSGFRYNRKMNQIHIDTNWEENIIVGQYLTFDCYSVVDPDTWPTVYNDINKLILLR